MLKKIIKNALYNSNYLRKIILLESNPDFSDNTRALFEEMINREINNKYKLIWIVNNTKNFKHIKIRNVKFIDNKNFFSKIQFKFYNYCCKYIIDCNKFIQKKNKNQIRIHLTHGAFLKLPRDYCLGCGEIDYLIQLSDFFTRINSELFKIDSSKIYTTGYPRNDSILNDKKQNSFSEFKGMKKILWLPTYRNHKNQKSNDIYNMKIEFPYGVPCINTKEQLIELNKLLNRHNIVLLIKLHPVEDDSTLKSINLSNIFVIDNNYFEENNSFLYEYLNDTDALITDYSSIYYDYLLTDKPIGLAIPDINEYKKHVELLFDDFENNIIGNYIYSYNDLYNFINCIAKNDKKIYSGLLQAKEKFHKYYDNNSSKRIIDLIKYWRN